MGSIYSALRDSCPRTAEPRRRGNHLNLNRQQPDSHLLSMEEIDSFTDIIRTKLNTSNFKELVLSDLHTHILSHKEDDPDLSIVLVAKVTEKKY